MQLMHIRLEVLGKVEMRTIYLIAAFIITYFH